jgi:NAD(P)-dependent dehydrogenase (short-subunit alcohol dehydrogenase family)
MNIIITGASKGIGFTLTRLLVDDTKNKVFAISRQTKELEKLAGEIHSDEKKGELYFYGFDLRSEDYHETLIPEIENKLGRVDILINNAGAMVNKPFEKLTDQEYDLVFDVNIKSPFRLIRDILPLFNKPGHIINITSMGGFQGSAKFPGLSLYSSSKGALAVLTECLAEELKDRQIKVNALALGAVQTEMLAEAFPGYNAPLQPDEISLFIKDFALNGFHYFNGKILPVSVSTP